MSSTNTGMTTTANTGAALAGSLTKLKSFGVRDWIYIISFVISIALFSTSVGLSSQFLGNNDDWNTLKPRITQISILVTVGIVLFWLGSMLYISTSDVLSIYFCLTVACLSLGLGFWAVIVASITR